MRTIITWEAFLGNMGYQHQGNMSERNSQVEENLMTKLAKGAADGPVWMPKGLKWLNAIHKLKKI